MDYVAHFPPCANGGGAFRPGTLPLILSLHGASKRGDKDKLLAQCPLLRHAQQHSLFPFIILAPICPRGTEWSKPGKNAAAQYPPSFVRSFVRLLFPSSSASSRPSSAPFLPSSASFLPSFLPFFLSILPLFLFTPTKQPQN
jgi:hypothetical protein